MSIILLTNNFIDFYLVWQNNDISGFFAKKNTIWFIIYNYGTTSKYLYINSPLHPSNPLRDMFGVLASGRLPNTAVTQLSESGFLLQVEGASTINHLSVFMTGTVPFSDGFGGSIHLGWPSPDGSEPPWQYLGFISNEKPSAVFRINKTDPGSVYKEAFNLTGNRMFSF